MKYNSKSLFFITLVFVSTAYADDDRPRHGIVYGVSENRSLKFDCKESGPELITCNFILASVVKKTTEDEANAKILEEMEKYESVLEELKNEKDLCDMVNLMIDVFEGKKEPPDPVAWKKSMLTRNQIETDYMKSRIVNWKNLCDNPTKNNYRKVISAEIIKDSKTCHISSQNYQQTLKHIQDYNNDTEVWTVKSEPHGACGLIQLDRFERVEPSTGHFFWNYFAKKSISNKNSKTLFGTECADLDENEYAYNWMKPEPIYLGCEYIEHSVF